ncbi:hypothetical protein [Leifsonia sp. 22587]|uniref:hypothetical protein n=1 Tax=Leifsonia sp. 22587 TaxID=3453946 RepID=UPI003F82E99E
MSADSAATRPRHGYWLLASIPLALAIDVCCAAFGRFWWCAFNTCLYAPGDVVGTSLWVAAAGVVMFLAVALPPWIPGWRRAAIAGGAALIVAVPAALFAFRVI